MGLVRKEETGQGKKHKGNNTLIKKVPLVAVGVL